MTDDPSPEITLATTMLKRHEGYRQFPYHDTRGDLSIGYGRNLRKEGIDPIEAELLLRRDATEACNRLSSFPWFHTLDTARQAALIDLTVNVGFEGFLQFRLMRNWLEVGDFAAAAGELKKSVAWHQEPNRIDELARIIMTGKVAS